MDTQDESRGEHEKKTFHLSHTDDEKRAIILTNIVKMLVARGITDDQKNLVQDLIKTGTDDLVYNTKILQKTATAIKGFKSYAIKFHPQKISSLGSATGVTDFVNDYRDSYKFLIVNDITEKAYNELVGQNETEVFFEHELMLCVIEHVLVPKHEVLSNDEAKKRIKKYNTKRTQMKKINNTDPVARFYNLKPGMVVKIISPSEIAGWYTGYRICKKANLFAKK
jgi:DNA-directed RNA polymerase subunit H (RpoH/RPB5)